MSSKTGKAADFETAISETSFGFYNLLLFFVTVSSTFAVQFEIASLSYAYPAAQCDLNLTLEDRGLVNALIYTGMIISSFLWGPLIDIFGRRKTLIVSHMLDCIFVVMASFTPNLGVLITAKFLGGFIINGPAMAITPYLSEFHGAKYRSRALLITGLLYNGSNIILPLLAWGVLPLDTQYRIGDLEFHSWNLFLLICTVPAFTSGLFFYLMPESPKYLMSKGNNEEALKVFRKVYKLNTGQPPKNYSVKELMDDQHIYQKGHSVANAWKQISPLFSRKYFPKLILVCLLIMFIMISVNSLRLWLPEIFQLMNDYELDNNGTTTFCQMLDTIQPTQDITCSMNFNNSSVYINSVIVAISIIVGYLAAAIVVNIVGKRRLLVILGLISGACVCSIYFAPDSITALVLICVHVMASCVCIDIILAIMVDLFPTQLRASAVSMALMFGRVGSVFGNAILPIMLQAGCAPPFFTFGSIIIGGTLLALLLPNTDFKALE